MFELYQGDCLELMKDIQDESIDCIICDLPYQITACAWDKVIPFNEFIDVNNRRYNKQDFLLKCFKEKNKMSYEEADLYFEDNKHLGLWSEYKRIIKRDGAIVLFGSEPFSTMLRNSNIDMYKYDWIWKKNTVDGFFNAKCRPLKTTENISVFSKSQARAKGENMKYFPQGLIEINKKLKDSRRLIDEHKYFRESRKDKEYTQKYTNYPTNILEFDKDVDKLHPTQKPVALMEYLIKTYTNEGDTVLDNCMGSGTTGVACKNTNRNFIGIEKDEKYFEIAKRRILDCKR